MNWLPTALRVFWALVPVYDAIVTRVPKAQAKPKPPPAPKLGNQQVNPEDPAAKYAGLRH